MSIIGIPITELLPETKAKLNLNQYQVEAKLIILGRVLSALQGITRKEASWVLREALHLVDITGRRPYALRKRKPLTAGGCPILA